MNKDTKKSLTQFAYLSSVGIGMAVAIFGSLFLGVYLDKKLGTGHIFTIILLIMGIIAGFKNIIDLVRKYGSDNASFKRHDADDKEPPRRKD